MPGQAEHPAEQVSRAGIYGLMMFPLTGRTRDGLGAARA